MTSDWCLPVICFLDSAAGNDTVIRFRNGLVQSGATLAGPEEHGSIPFGRVISRSSDGDGKQAG